VRQNTDRFLPEAKIVFPVRFLRNAKYRLLFWRRILISKDPISRCFESKKAALSGPLVSAGPNGCREDCCFV